MADQSFPQIPTTVWWGVRQFLQKTPKAKLDENMLSATLSVQQAAAKQYIGELKKVGLLDEEGRATALANLWRMDETYADSVRQIASGSYPEGLVTISPPESPDRQRAVNWFMTQGLGEGSAKNKAATYLLITSLTPNEAVPQTSRSEAKGKSANGTVRQATGRATTGQSQKLETPSSGSSSVREGSVSSIPLNLNVQIHISADASSEQIETIFSAMRKYLRND